MLRPSWGRLSTDPRAAAILGPSVYPRAAAILGPSVHQPTDPRAAAILGLSVHQSTNPRAAAAILGPSVHQPTDPRAAAISGPSVHRPRHWGGGVITVQLKPDWNSNVQAVVPPPILRTGHSLRMWGFSQECHVDVSVCACSLSRERAPWRHTLCSVGF